MQVCTVILPPFVNAGLEVCVCVCVCVCATMKKVPDECVCVCVCVSKWQPPLGQHSNPGQLFRPCGPSSAGCWVWSSGESTSEHKGLCSAPCLWVQAEQDHYTGLCSNHDNKCVCVCVCVVDWYVFFPFQEAAPKQTATKVCNLSHGENKLLFEFLGFPKTFYTAPSQLCRGQLRSLYSTEEGVYVKTFRVTNKILPSLCCP